MMDEEQVVQGESTAPVKGTLKDSFNVTNPFAIPYNYPEQKFNAASDSRGKVDMEDEKFKSVYDTADGATKVAMLKANNNSDALKIAFRRDVFNESARKMEQNGTLEAFGMNLLTGSLTPSTLLPLGVVFKGAQIAKGASRLLNAGTVGLAGGVVGATANVVDEGIFDMQGMPTNYISAGAYGFAFGFGLGAIGGALSGPRAKNVANSIDPKQDTFSRDFDKDSMFTLELDENGIPKIQTYQQMEKSMLDRVPLLGKLLRSDVHTVMQSDDGILRSLMMRIANPSVAMRDANGVVIPSTKNGWDTKIEAKGIHNNLVEEMTQSFEVAKTKGFKGSLDDFNLAIYTQYTEAMTTQRNRATQYANEMNTDATMEIEAKRKAELEEAKGDVSFYKDAEGKEQLVTKELIESGIEFEPIIKKRDKKTVEGLVEEINTRHNEEADLKRKEVMDEWYNVNAHKFNDEVLGQGAGAYNKYFQTMLKKSQDLGIKELQGINTNKLYIPRVYNYKAIQNGSVDKTIMHSELKAAIINDSRNTKLGDADIDQLAEEISGILMKTSFNIQNVTTSFLAKDLPFGARLKQQKLYLNDAYMPSLLRKDMDDLVGAYQYGMSGRQGTQFAFGTDNLDEILRTVNEAHAKAGTVPKAEEIQAFTRSIEDLLGTLRMNTMANTPQWEWTRNVLSYNSARLMGGAGGNQFIELAGAVMMNGTKALLSGRIFKSLKNTSDLLYAKNGKHDEFSRFLIASGHMEEALHTTRVNRLTDAEVGFNSGVVENSLNWMNDKLMKYNGMRYFMGVMEDMTGGAVVTKLKEGSFSTKDLARIGLSDVDAKALQTALKDITTTDWDLSKLTSKQQDQLQLAISRGIADIVVQGDSIHLPGWMKAPGPMLKLLTQFMRFPLIAQETLMRKGMSDNKAQMAAGVLGSVSAYLGIKYLREQAAIATGMLHPIDAKYDYEEYDDDDWFRVTGEALNYTANLGMMGSVADLGLLATGHNQLGKDWADKKAMPSLVGPTGGLVEDMFTLTKAIAEGDVTDERTLKKIRTLAPFMTLPLIKEGADMLIEEMN